MSLDRRHWENAGELERSGVPFVVATMVGTRGSAPQDPGSKIIVTAEGLHSGTVGGGKVEAKCIATALELLAAPPGEPKLYTWNLQRDIGMSCGGEGTFLFETHARETWKIAIFGAGHCAQALVRVLAPLECRVTLVDNRPEWMGKLPDAPNLRRVLAEEPALEVAKLEKGTFFAVMTRGHATDMPVLRAIAESHPDAAYFGVIGSDVKGIKIRSELAAAGVPAGFIERLRCPMGLAFGGERSGRDRAFDRGTDAGGAGSLRAPLRRASLGRRNREADRQIGPGGPCVPCRR
jgi:xanthine dehydrogenase accessory factor